MLIGVYKLLKLIDKELPFKAITKIYFSFADTSLIIETRIRKNHEYYLYFESIFYKQLSLDVSFTKEYTNRVKDFYNNIDTNCVKTHIYL